MKRRLYVVEDHPLPPMPAPTLAEAGQPLADYLRLRAAEGAGALLSPRGCELVAELLIACRSFHAAKTWDDKTDASLELVDAITDLQKEGML